jgi:hypothetical protein
VSQLPEFESTDADDLDCAIQRKWNLFAMPDPSVDAETESSLPAENSRTSTDAANVLSAKRSLPTLEAM